MKIVDKIIKNSKDNVKNPPITIAFLGDSVTKGVFESKFDETTKLFTGTCENKCCYSSRLKEILNILCPFAQINVINSGINGDSASGGNSRFERDIAPFSPDLVVVAFALNDSVAGKEGLELYKNSLEEIFNKVKNIGAECILLTPNIMSDKVSIYLNDEKLIESAKMMIDIDLDLYVCAAKETAIKNGVTICDVNSKWKILQKAGVDTTELLSNKINHPIREMHLLTAYLLAETIFEN